MGRSRCLLLDPHNRGMSLSLSMEEELQVRECSGLPQSHSTESRLFKGTRDLF